MKKMLKKTKAKIFVAGLIFMNLTLAIISGSAYADEVLWEFNVPIKLKNMPEVVEYVVIKWGLYQDGSVVGGDSIFIPMDAANSKGDFPPETITIYESDVDDSAKPEYAIFSLKLSKDGSEAYSPNTNGKNWTKNKSGSTLKEHVMVINLQTKPEKGPW